MQQNKEDEIVKGCYNCYKTQTWNGCGIFHTDGKDCSWWEEIPKRKSINDKMIECMVDLIFNCEVDLNEPNETVRQIKEKLKREGFNV